VSQLVEYPLQNGGAVRVQVSNVETDGPEGLVTRGRLHDAGAEMLHRAQDTFEDTLATIRPAAEALLATLTELNRVPDEIGVEFGVQLSAQAGAVIATLGSATNFKVTLTWRRPAGG
jgi:hypothetical protein